MSGQVRIIYKLLINYLSCFSSLKLSGANSWALKFDNFIFNFINHWKHPPNHWFHYKALHTTWICKAKYSAIGNLYFQQFYNSKSFYLFSMHTKSSEKVSINVHARISRSEMLFFRKIWMIFSFSFIEKVPMQKIYEQHQKQCDLIFIWGSFI